MLKSFVFPERSTTSRYCSRHLSKHLNLKKAPLTTINNGWLRDDVTII